LYERDQAADFSKFIEQHTKAHCDVIIVDPGRGQFARFSKKMTNFDYTISKTQICTDVLRDEVSGEILHYHR
jgi:hypothetical protein